MTDPALTAAAVSALGISAGVVGTWLRGRTLERLHQARVDGRSEVVRTLTPGSRLIDLDEGTVLIEVGPCPNNGSSDGPDVHSSSCSASPPRRRGLASSLSGRRDRRRGR